MTSLFEEVNEAPPLGLQKLYSISPFVYPIIGSGITIIVSLLVSVIPCFRHKKHVDSKLLFPCVRRFVKHHDEKEVSGETAEKCEALLLTEPA